MRTATSPASLWPRPRQVQNAPPASRGRSPPRPPAGASPAIPASRQRPLSLAPGGRVGAPAPSRCSCSKADMLALAERTQCQTSYAPCRQDVRVTGPGLAEAQTALARASVGAFSLNRRVLCCRAAASDARAWVGGTLARGCVSAGASAPPIPAKQAVISSRPPAHPRCWASRHQGRGRVRWPGPKMPRRPQRGPRPARDIWTRRFWALCGRGREARQRCEE